MPPAYDRFDVRAATAARIFGIVALAVPILWGNEIDSIAALLTLAVLWAYFMLALPVPRTLTTVVPEATAVGLLCGATLHEAPTVLGALAVAPFVAGIGRGARGVLISLSVQLIALLTLSLLARGTMTEAASLAVFTWTMVGLGLGLMAGMVSASRAAKADPLAPYREARNLLSGLLDLSGELGAGLEPELLASDVLTVFRDALPTASLALLVPREEAFLPLITRSGVHDEGLAALELVPTAADQQETQIDDRCFAVPLVDQSRLVGVVAGSLAPQLDPDRVGLRARLQEAAGESAGLVVRLETALLFDRLRHLAATEERRRLAREMHDGVAQDIAYLGYLVDALLLDPKSPEQADQLHDLRGQITAVVGEVRRSVLKLRSEAANSESLGAAIGTLARHLSDVSGVPITVTVDERTTRLRPEVEAEVLRICQEALNNAVRHADATVIDVRCKVDPPRVELTVTDDGRGLQQGRTDSYGLSIMRERARLIGAELSVGNGAEGGARVSLRVGASTPHEPLRV